MGYTSYYSQVGPKPTNAEWEQICAEASAILTRHADIVCRESDQPDDPPQIDGRYIIFNGRAEDGHETMVVDREQQGFEFCKTARKPYDAAVVEVLRAVKKICPKWLELSSDGDGEEQYNGGPVFP